MMQTPLSRVFAESAAEAHAAFPEKLENLLVLVTFSETPVYVSPEIAEHLTKNVAAVKEAVTVAAAYIRDHGATAMANRNRPLAGISVNAIAINADASTGLLSPEFTEEMKRIATFDHETGHLVVENGYSSNYHLAECAADAYAALRHVQRFGRETDFLEYYNKAYAIVMDLSPAHYTNEAIQRVGEIVRERDISGLSLRETAELAAKIAQECSLKQATLDKISETYKPVAEAYKDKAGRSVCIRRCFEVMQKYENDPDIYKAGKRYLNSPVNSQYAAKNELSFWQEAQDFMARHEEKSTVEPSLKKPPLSEL